MQLNLAFQLGDRDWVTVLLQQLLADYRRDLIPTSTCHYVGELLRENGDLRQAHRWLTPPISYDALAEELAGEVE